MALQHRVAVITGAGSGIGKATAKRLASQGMTVCVCDCDLQSAQAVADEIGWQAHAWKMDVANAAEVRDTFEAIKRDLEPVTVLVTAAGIPGHGLVSHLNDELWQSVLDINLSGTFYCVREAVKQMLCAGGGTIITLSSICGVMGCATCPAYSASKAGVIGLSKAVARRHTADGIRVNVVAPGLIDTPFVEPDRQMGKLQAGIEKIPVGRMGTPGEIAELIAFLCGDSASFISGQVISPNGGQMI
jgi:NAD(P)-dependent dehydrogenase (short-subunit alcohol dehydrogenase family)